MHPWTLLTLCGLLLAGPASGAAHPACGDPGYPYQDLSPDQLRAVASSCEDPDATRLYYNRADHADLVAAAERYEQYLHTPQGRRLGHRDGVRRVRDFATYRTYMELLEGLAHLWQPDPARRMALLNREYEHRGTLADLRLRGFEHLANLQEREFRQLESRGPRSGGPAL